MGQCGVAKTPRFVLVSTAAVARHHAAPGFPGYRQALSLRSIEHYCAALLLPIAASTTIAPVMCGCKEQKYSYVPGVVNVNENLSLVSSALDLKSLPLEATVCGNVVVIDPGHGRAGLHGDALRREGECVDVHLLIRRPAPTRQERRSLL